MFQTLKIAMTTTVCSPVALRTLCFYATLVISRKQDRLAKASIHVMFASRIFTKVGPKILFTNKEHSHHKAKQQSSCVSHTPAQMEAVYLLSSLIKIADSFIPTATNWAQLAMDNFTTVWSRYTLSRSSNIRNSWYLICHYHCYCCNEQIWRKLKADTDCAPIFPGLTHYISCNITVLATNISLHNYFL